MKRLWIFSATFAAFAAVAGCWAADNAGRSSTPADKIELRARHYTPRKVFESPDKRIDESSGLAASRRYPGYLWTHNDSGDTARLFLLSPTGATVATVNLENANAFDWEDMAIGGEGENSWVYAGDIGDNFRWRSSLTVYRFREPEIDLTKTDQTVNLRAEKMTLEYTGQQSDAETLIALPDSRLIIVTKVASGSRIWQTPKAFEDGAKQTMQHIGEYSFKGDKTLARLATGGDLSSDGRRLAVITYTNLYEWIVPLNEGGAPDWATLWKTTPQISPLPELKQIESVCYSADGEKVFVSSEGTPMPLYAMEP